MKKRINIDLKKAVTTRVYWDFSCIRLRNSGDQQKKRATSQASGKGRAGKTWAVIKEGCAYLEKTLDFSRKVCYNGKAIVSIKNGKVRLPHFYISEGGKLL